MGCTTCSQCGEGVFNVPLYRNAPKGVPCKDWRCEGCLDLEFKPDSETVKIANIISEEGKNAK